jgi:hypothetical protein
MYRINMPGKVILSIEDSFATFDWANAFRLKMCLEVPLQIL